MHLLQVNCIYWTY